jgi:hypothetical protein
VPVVFRNERFHNPLLKNGAERHQRIFTNKSSACLFIALFQVGLLTGTELWWATLQYRSSIAMLRKKGYEIGSSEHNCSELLRKKVKVSP